MNSPWKTIISFAGDGTCCLSVPLSRSFRRLEGLEFESSLGSNNYFRDNEEQSQLSICHAFPAPVILSVFFFSIDRCHGLWLCFVAMVCCYGLLLCFVAMVCCHGLLPWFVAMVCCHGLLVCRRRQALRDLSLELLNILRLPSILRTWF